MEIEEAKAYFNKEGYTLLTQEYKNQQQRLEYVCPNGHKRTTTWKNWKKGARCLICKNQRTKLSIEEVRLSFEKEGYTLLSKEYISNKTKLDYVCPEGHKSSITWADWNTGGYRCGYCANNKKLSIKDVISDLNKEEYEFVSGNYANNTSILLVKCPKGHEFETSRVKWTSGNRCPVCYDSRIDINVISESFRKQGYTLLSKKYVDAHTKLKYICPQGHTHKISWSAWQQGQRCFYCRNLKHRIPLKEVQKMFRSEEYIFIEESYLKNKLEYICPKGHFGSVSLGNWKTNGVRCPTCGNNGTSVQEQDLINHIEALEIDINVRDRLLIKPKELDVVVPSKKIAIEYCGLYWHSELMDKNNDYHIDKLKKCNNAGYKLITIFEDEWVNKKEIVLSRLKNILNVKKGIKKLYARNLIVKEIDTKSARQFCEKNHLQGYTGSTIKLGAFYNDELVSVMTFSKPSLAKGSNSKTNPHTWELSRFCSKLSYRVVGVASKLLSYFKKHYVWIEIFSYSDRRWSDGNLYEQLGFQFTENTKPNYWYFVDGGAVRKHRFALRKQPNEPKDTTEWELRQAQGWNRIWDCGNKKYVMTNESL
jgi:hypothetical protein